MIECLEQSLKLIVKTKEELIKKFLETKDGQNKTTLLNQLEDLDNKIIDYNIKLEKLKAKGKLILLFSIFYYRYKH